MRRSIVTLLSALLAAATASAQIETVSAEHRTEDSFKRVSEYLSGQASNGRYAVFRTDPSERDGFYISLIAESKAGVAKVSSVRVHAIEHGAQEAETHEMAAALINKRRLLVGLTHQPWNEPAARPSAWKVELLDASGAVIESAASFLWAVPTE